MKQGHNLLSCEVHEFANTIPELNKMVFAVQALGKFEALKDVNFEVDDPNTPSMLQLHSVMILN